MDNINISALRREYFLKELHEENVHKNPFEEFLIWFGEALNSKVNDPNAMVLSTASKNSKPSLRIVLMKSVDQNGFKFFTNYKSKKAKELLENPNAAILFFWHELERQINISGTVEKISKKESEEYFKTRPYQSQIGAWASEQSEVIPNREFLNKKFEDLKIKYKDGEVPLPPFWGGFKLIPDQFEFWQGRPSRLHDRIRYKKSSENIWKIERLSP